MIFCVDADYRPAEVVTACVGVHTWTDAMPAAETVIRTAGRPPEYQPGAFYRRELPYLVAIVAALVQRPQLIVVDGYVWLGPGRPGLGAHLHAILGGDIAIVGVAKRPFRDAAAISVIRGISQRPLFVTAIGTDVVTAAEAVRTMHGRHRIPTILKRVDQLSRA